jgi:hypothetical protein
MYKAARLEFAAQDQNINRTPWQRAGGRSVNVTPGQIIFRGRPVNNFSREWGHIIILPGARAAFFRNVLFENFRKDTTVDRFPIYLPNTGAIATLNAGLAAADQWKRRGNYELQLAHVVAAVRVPQQHGTLPRWSPAVAAGAGGDWRVPDTGHLCPPRLRRINPNPYLTENATAAPISQAVKAIDQIYSKQS